VSIIQVKVKPRARQSAFTQVADGTYIAEIRAAPVDGRANAELVALVARHFGCPKAAVTIKSGHASRTKLVKIATG
jgi:uncharacterized protein (TIGR00251 family)